MNAASPAVLGYWPVFGTQPGDGLWPKTPLKNAGSADRAADVRAEADRRAARADGRALAARGAAGDPMRVVGVAGAAVDAVVGLDPHRHLGRVGHAERDEAGVDQPLRRRRRRVGAAVAPRDEPRAVGHPAQRDRLLDRARHAEERRQRSSSPAAAIRASAASASASASAKRSQAIAFVRGWRRVEAPRVGLDDLARGQLASADRSREVTGTALCRRGHGLQHPSRDAAAHRASPTPVWRPLSHPGRPMRHDRAFGSRWRSAVVW